MATAVFSLLLYLTAMRIARHVVSILIKLDSNSHV
jgi:hypothetical protein